MVSYITDDVRRLHVEEGQPKISGVYYIGFF